jgi:Tol biopolymer transport system component
VDGKLSYLANRWEYDAGTETWSLASVGIHVLEIDPADLVDGTHVPASPTLEANLPSVGSYDWAPDGHGVVFATSGTLHWADDSDGYASWTEIPTTGIPDHPRWSPDGMQIVFRSDRGIERIDADGESETLLVAHTRTRSVFLPYWSPNATHLLFHSREAVKQGRTTGYTATDVYRITADGTGETNLVDGLTGNWSTGGWR